MDSINEQTGQQSVMFAHKLSYYIFCTSSLALIFTAPFELFTSQNTRLSTVVMRNYPDKVSLPFPYIPENFPYRD